MFQYIPKKSKEIYNEVIAHRGFHLVAPENTLSAFEEAIRKNYAIELDIRPTKDNRIICIHDRKTKRLLGIGGKTSKKTYEELKKYCILKTDETIPTFSQVLKLVDGKISLLVEVKGFFTLKYEKALIKDLQGYTGKVYFHAKNIVTYFRLTKIWKDRVFWVLNPFRKRFCFIKNKEYKVIKMLDLNR